MSNITYKVCTGTTAEELEASVQECLDVNYSIQGNLFVSSTIDSSNNINYLFAQAVKRNNE